MNSTQEVMFLTVKDMAAMFRCCVRSIPNMVERGDIPAPEKFGKMTRWNRAKVLQHISKDEKQPA